MQIEHLGYTYTLTSRAGVVTIKYGSTPLATDEASADGLNRALGRMRADAKKRERKAGRLERRDGTRHADYTVLASDLETGEYGLRGLAMAWFLRGNRLSREGCTDAIGCADARWAVAPRKGEGASFDGACESIADAMPEFLHESLDWHEIRDALSEVVSAFPSIKSCAEAAQELKESNGEDHWEKMMHEQAEYLTAQA